MAEKCIFNHERCEPSLLCGQCPHYLQRSFDRGDTLEYRAGVNDEWHSFSKNTCCDGFKFLQHLQYRVKPAEPEIKTGEVVLVPLAEERESLKEFKKYICGHYRVESVNDLPLSTNQYADFMQMYEAGWGMREQKFIDKMLEKAIRESNGKEESHNED